MTQPCLKCGTGNPDSNRFCVSCGRPLSPNLQEATPSPPEQAPADARKVCEGCRTVNEASAAHCYLCGLKLPDQLYTQAEVVGNPAGFWIRLGARIIDDVLLAIASVLMTAALTGIELEQAIGGLIGVSEGWDTTVVTLFDLALSIAYYTFTTGRWGQTLGKAVLGLKVTRADGSRLSFGRSFGRYWAYLVSAIPFGLGFVAIALSSQKRGWHDFICDTRVVNLRS